jgi:hypothetical protein
MSTSQPKNSTHQNFTQQKAPNDPTDEPHLIILLLAKGKCVTIVSFLSIVSVEIKQATMRVPLLYAMFLLAVVFPSSDAVKQERKSEENDNNRNLGVLTAVHHSGTEYFENGYAEAQGYTATDGKKTGKKGYDGE